MKREHDEKLKLYELNKELDLARIATEQVRNRPISDEVYREREKFKEKQFSLNGEYVFNRELQNEDFIKLKMLYVHSAVNFHILNESLKDIVYKWPERSESIANIIQDEKEKMAIGGKNSYEAKLYRFMTDGETVNKNREDDLTYREFNLPRRFENEDDIKQDPIFSFPDFHPSRANKPKI